MSKIEGKERKKKRRRRGYDDEAAARVLEASRARGSRANRRGKTLT